MSIVEKLIHIQNTLKAPKNNFNKFGNYNYRSAEDILEAVKPLNAEQGLLLNLSDKAVNIEGWHYIEATARLTDGTETIEVQAYARESEIKKGMDSSQITGTASSYARKYALNGLYLIDDTKDADTDEYTKQNKQDPPKASAKQLDLINKLLDKKASDKYPKDALYQALKSKMNINTDMESWTSKQASDAITILNSDKK